MVLQVTVYRVADGLPLTGSTDIDRRPEMYLQKTKQRYLNTRSLTTKLNLSQMSAELKLHPPYVVQEGEIGIVDNSIMRSVKDTYRPVVTPGRRLLPIGWVGMISIFLNLICMALNLTRGMTIVSHGHYDEEDQGAYTFGAVFLLAALACIYQVYLTFYYCRWRKLKTLLSLAVLCWCCFFLEQFRNEYQLGFHCGVAAFSSLVIVRRRLTEKLPGYSV